jgi:hypothetical protein
VGSGRSRPNKWWIEPHPSTATGSSCNVWKEWAYATDDPGHHYYCERWERISNEDGATDKDGATVDTDPTMPVVALRKVQTSAQDGIIVVVGDHFSYCLGQPQDGITLQQEMAENEHYKKLGSKAALVDAALEQNDLKTARDWLGSIQGGHGRISAENGWLLDSCIEFWKEGTPLWDSRKDVEVVGITMEECRIIWEGDEWYVFESNLKSVDDLREIIWYNGLSCAKALDDN